MLNIKEEMVDSFELVEISDKHLKYILKLKRKKEMCPKCGTYENRFIDYNRRIINHDLISHKNTDIILLLRRYQCKNCDKRFYETNPLVTGKHRVSNATIINVMNDLRNPLNTFKSVGISHHLSATTIIKIFDSMLPHVDRITLPEVLGIDEIHIPIVLYKSKYICVMMDIVTNYLTEVLYSRKKNHLDYYFSKISKDERDKVLFFSCDMYDTYISIAHKYLKNAIICVDPFHVCEHALMAFNDVRISVENQLKHDKKAKYLFNQFRWLLTNSKIDLDNEGKYNKTIGYVINYRGLLNMMLSYSPELNDAYYFYRRYLDLNKRCTIENCEEYIDAYLSDVYKSNLPSFIKFADMIVNYKEYIINSFHTYKGKRITNASMESLNGRIDKLNSNANGYKNFDRFRIRALYCFNPNVKYRLNENYSSNKIKK